MKLTFRNIILIIYSVLLFLIAFSGTYEYLTWLNPLDLKVEENPKQHDGSQEFNPPREWESSIQPAPDDDGVTRYLNPWELHHHGKEEIIYTPQTEELSSDE